VHAVLNTAGIWLLTTALPRVGTWVLTTVLPWLLVLLLVAPLAAALTERRRRARHWQSRTAGHEALLYGWTQVATAIAMGYVYLKSALRTIETRDLSRIAYEAAARGFELGTMTSEEMEFHRKSTETVFSSFTDWLDRAEREFREGHAKGAQLQQQTGSLAIAVEADELASLLRLRMDLGDITLCAESLVGVIRDARVCRSATQVPICDHLLANRRVRDYMEALLAKPPEDPLVVRVVDRVLSRLQRKIKKFEQRTGVLIYEFNSSRELEETRIVRTGEVLEVPEKVFPTVAEQRQWARELMALPPYLSWIADYAKWAAQLREPKPS
jgi:hypothetical protein